MVKTAVQQIVDIYRMMSVRDVSTDVREILTKYLTNLVEGGEADPERLTVCGLVYLRQLDGTLKPEQTGFTGL
jgi:hypothetical protein